MGNDRAPILITGGCGFLGRYLAADLNRNGYRAALFDLRDERRSMAPQLRERCPFFKGDVANLADVLEAVRTLGVKSIVHAAAVIPPQSDSEPYQGVKVNLLGTCHVLEAARLLDLQRITFVSSGAVYGAADTVCVEDAPIASDPAHGLYGAGKVAAELMGLKYARLFGYEFTTARVAAVYGAGGTADHYLNILVQHALQAQPVQLDRGGDHGFEFVHAVDAAAGIRLIHTAGELKHRIYNVGTGIKHTLAQLAALIKSHLPAADFSIGPGLLPQMPQREAFDIARISRLGYRPRFDLATGLQEYLESVS